MVSPSHARIDAVGDNEEDTQSDGGGTETDRNNKAKARRASILHLFHD
jgi:hypothetical protein